MEKAKKKTSTSAACQQKALKISAKARYALRILMDIATYATQGKLRTGSAIAESQQISEKFLSRIVVELRDRGLLRSVRGNIGGFQLARNPDDIRLLDIVEAVQGPVAILDCLAPGAAESCGRLESCQARRIWADVNASFSATLAKVTLSAVLKRVSDTSCALDYCI